MADELRYSDLPRTLAVWMALEQARLMLRHLADAPTHWPENAIYCHSCVTALRSVTFLLQKALAHAEGFDEWYEGVQARLAADSEFQFLKHARNYVLKEGALEIEGSAGFTSTGENGLVGMEIRGIGPDGPDVWAVDPVGGESAPKVPVDWRRLPGFEFIVDLRIAPAAGLPAPPARELKEMLAEKIEVLSEVLREADDRFDEEDWDPGIDSLIDSQYD